MMPLNSLMMHEEDGQRKSAKECASSIFSTAVIFYDTVQKHKGVTTCGPTLGHNLSLVPLRILTWDRAKYETHSMTLSKSVSHALEYK